MLILLLFCHFSLEFSFWVGRVVNWEVWCNGVLEDSLIILEHFSVFSVVESLWCGSTC